MSKDKLLIVLFDDILNNLVSKRISWSKFTLILETDKNLFPSKLNVTEKRLKCFELHFEIDWNEKNRSRKPGQCDFTKTHEISGYLYKNSFLIQINQRVKQKNYLFQAIELLSVSVGLLFVKFVLVQCLQSKLVRRFCRGRKY